MIHSSDFRGKKKSCKVGGFHAFVDGMSTGVVTRAEFGVLRP
jgi:hypothetical protein